MSANVLDFVHETKPEPHLERRAKILAAHPEVVKLIGNTPSSFGWVVLITAFQIGLAAWTSQLHWGWMLVVAYVIGASLNHNLYVMIHEATHNMIFRTTVANKWAGIFCNLAQGLPGAIGFRMFHVLHHNFQGELSKDADIPSPWEARLVGTSPWRKAVWMFFFMVNQATWRPSRVAKNLLWNRWSLTNYAVQIAFDVLVVSLFGWQGLAYLLASTVFSLGLHPLGARWIQEHYIMVPGQETHSYYGPGNWIQFQIGHHNEHHDFMTIPWSRLPKLRAMAPEFYNTIYYHTSWTKLLLRFLFDRNLSLFSRVVRPDGTNAAGILKAQQAQRAAVAARRQESQGEALPGVTRPEVMPAH